MIATDVFVVSDVLMELLLDDDALSEGDVLSASVLSSAYGMKHNQNEQSTTII